MISRLLTFFILMVSLTDRVQAGRFASEASFEKQIASTHFLNQNSELIVKGWGIYGCVPTSFANGLNFLAKIAGFTLPLSPMKLVQSLSNFNSGQGVHNPMIPTLMQYGFDQVHFPGTYELSRVEIGSKRSFLKADDLASLRYPGRAIDLVSIGLHEILVLGASQGGRYLIVVDPVNGVPSEYDYAFLPIGASASLPAGYGKPTLWLHRAGKLGMKHQAPNYNDFYSGAEVDNINSLHLLP